MSQDRLGRGVRGVPQTSDVRASVVIPHRADEERGAPRGGVADGREDLVDGERFVADGQQPDRVRRRLLTGVIVVVRHDAMLPHGRHRRELPCPCRVSPPPAPGPGAPYSPRRLRALRTSAAVPSSATVAPAPAAVAASVRPSLRPASV